MISESVRVIDVDVPRNWRELKNGWYKTRDGFPLCSSHVRNFVDVLKNHTSDEWPYTTTVGYHDSHGWQGIELCQSVFQLDDRAAPTAPISLVTLLSKEIISIVDFGMVMSSSVVVEPTGSSASAPVEPDVTMTGSDSGGALHGLGGAQQQQQQLQQQQAVTTTSSATSGASSSANPVSVARGGPEVERPLIPTSIAVEASSDSMTIAGVEVIRDSSIVVLKAACEHMAISQSGSKAKLGKRLVSTVDTQKIPEETQLAATTLGDTLASPIPVQAAG